MNISDYFTGLSLFITLTIFIIGYLNEKRLRKNARRLDRIEKQLQLLYGPIYALILSRQKSWELFSSKFDMNTWFRGENYVGQKIPDSDLEPWKRWIKFEAQNTNSKIHDIIVNHSDLIIGYEMPECFTKFINHFAEYKWIVEKWDNNDDKIFFSDKKYPHKELEFYIKTSFLKLKYTQFNLQGYAFELDTSLDSKFKKKHDSHIEIKDSNYQEYFGQE